MVDVPDFIPDDKMPQAPTEPSGEAPDFIPEGKFVSDEEKYGTPSQKAIAAVEGVAKGLAGPLATYAETHLLGVKPEEIVGRAEASPWIHGLSEAGAFVGSMFAGVGEAALIGKAAEAATGLTKIGQAAQVVGKLGPQMPTLGAKVGAAALKGAIETGMFQGADEISKSMLGQSDPDTPVASAILNSGGAALLGGGVGGAFAAIGAGISAIAASKTAKESNEWLESLHNLLKKPTVEEQAAETSLARSTIGMKKEAPEILAAGERLGAPVMEGQTSSNKLTQMADDTLLRQPWTVNGSKRSNLYRQGYDIVTDKVNQIFQLGKMEEYEVGQQLQQTLTKDIAEAAKVHNERYSLIKELTPEIEVPIKALKSTATKIRQIEGVETDFTSDFAKMARNIATELEKPGSFDTVDKLRAYKSRLMGRWSNMSSEEKRIASIARSALADLEEKTIDKHADKFVTDILSRKDLTPKQMESIWGDKIDRLQALNSQIKDANAQYAPFRKKFSELADWLGKGRVAGPQDAIDFINERLEPEDVIRKLSSQRYANLPQFLKREFPEQFETIREFQKSKLFEKVNKSAKGNYTSMLKNFEAMPKVIKEMIFTPEELQTLQDAKTWLNSLPPSFNPSGTTHVRTLLEWAGSPLEAAKQEIGASILNRIVSGKEINPQIRKIIGREVSDAEAATALKVMSSGDAQGMHEMLDYVGKAERGFLKMNRAIESVFKGGSQKAFDAFVTDRERLKLKKYIEGGHFDEEVQKYMTDPSVQKTPPNYAEGGEVLKQQVANNYLAQHAPDQDLLMQSAKARLAQTLTALQPSAPAGKMVFDPIEKDPHAEKQFHKALDLAIQPLSILNHVKDGTLTPKQVKLFNDMYPEVYTLLNKQLTKRITIAQQKGERPPYQVRQALSLFLGAPLDSSLSPQSVQKNQAVFMKNKMAQMQAPQGGVKRGTSNLPKMAANHETSDQSRLMRQQHGKS